MQEKQSRIILLEGLPGSGKSTNSRIMMTNLDQSNKRVKWIHEVARPHPTLFFNEASLTFEEYNELIQVFPELQSCLESTKIVRNQSISIDLLEIEWKFKNEISSEAFEVLKKFDVWNFSLQKYMEVALEKWQCFVDFVKVEQDLIVILDSSIFQFQIYSFLEKNTPYEMLEDFVAKLFCLISDLDPTLVYLYQENVESAIESLEKSRGIEFFNRIWERDQYKPYYHNRPKGAEGYREFLRDYHKIARKLFEQTPFNKIEIEISNGDWDKHVADIMSFLRLKEINKEDTNVIYPIGTYENKELNLKLEVHEKFFIDPYGKKKQIIARKENDFYIEDLPVILRFEKNRIIIAGEQLIDRWTTSGMEFMKV
jgi:hypothetical protein